MKKFFSIIMLAAAVSLVTLSACGDADATSNASEEATSEEAAN